MTEGAMVDVRPYPSSPSQPAMLIRVSKSTSDTGNRLPVLGWVQVRAKSCVWYETDALTN